MSYGTYEDMYDADGIEARTERLECRYVHVTDRENLNLIYLFQAPHWTFKYSVESKINHQKRVTIC